MANTLPSSSLQFSSPFRFASSVGKSQSPKPLLTFTTRAAEPESPNEPEKPSQTETENSDQDSFDNRLSQIRLKYRSGTGKKAEQRKVKKPKKGSTSVAGGMYLPPVPLKEPGSGGLKLEFGFSPYSERINGRIAMLGLAALILVDLATGKSVLNYHTPSIVLIQIYFVAAASVHEVLAMLVLQLLGQSSKTAYCPLRATTGGMNFRYFLTMALRYNCIQSTWL